MERRLILLRTVALLFAIIAFTELILAATWGFALGAVIGSVCSLAHVWWWVTNVRPQKEPNKLRKFAGVCFWLLNCWVFILFVIRLAEPNPKWLTVADVPLCGPEVQNCFERTADVNTPYSTLTGKTRSWAKAHTRVLSETETDNYFVHGRAITGGFGFADDFVAYVVGNATHCTVFAQSRSRLGKADFGVNTHRLDTFMSAVLQ
eukprot:TRINITY_DN95752_c0_g1_i1.p1 TRINITY_DN95752_c0_g1~~TRINITY_DN95752_c0_g1_i1.p1  ORF type:complete len:205 (-),score=16.53 TRINITY_DN95752_c0_g1_i1:3-617(-)